MIGRRQLRQRAKQDPNRTIGLTKNLLETLMRCEGLIVIEQPYTAPKLRDLSNSKIESKSFLHDTSFASATSQFETKPVLSRSTWENLRHNRMTSQLLSKRAATTIIPICAKR